MVTVELEGAMADLAPSADREVFEVEFGRISKGEKGDKGDTGNKGDTGDTGKSAYEIAVEHGFIGTEEEWLASFRIDDGSITQSKIADGAVTKEKLAQAVQTLIEDGYVYKNIAAPIANPGTPTRKEFWIVPGLSGTFTHFGNITLSKKELALLKWNGNSWSYDHILYIDDAPKSNSDNLVSSGGVYLALQGKQNTIPDLSDIRSGASAGATAYQKPSGGIPETDLSASVQSSLGKADTALQTETEPQFNASPAATITEADKSTWNSQFIGFPMQKSKYMAVSGAMTAGYGWSTTGWIPIDSILIVESKINLSARTGKYATTIYPVLFKDENDAITTGETVANVYASSIIPSGTKYIAFNCPSLIDNLVINKIPSILDEIIADKADKVAEATAGNFAGLDASGNLTDSGKKATDFATAAQGTKADNATNVTHTAENRDVDALMQALEYTTTTPTITETAQYLENDGDIVNIASGYTLLAVDVVEGEIYKITAETSPSFNALYAYYNGATKVSYFGTGLGTITDKFIIIPNGVNKLYVQKKGTTGSIEKVNITTAKGVTQLQTEVSQIVEAESVVMSGTITPSKYLKANGKIADISGTTYSVGEYVVVAGFKYHFWFAGYTGQGGYSFMDANGNVLSVVTNAGNAILTEAEVTAPENAVKLNISIVNGLPAKDVQKYTGAYNVVSNMWKGKKWAVVGDSLTEVNSRATKRYHDYIAEKTKISVVNMGVSGTGYKRGYDNSNAFYQRIGSVPADADVITIFGSFNDSPYIANELGTKTDSGTTTLGGCINTTLDNLFTAYPLAVVGIVSPTPWVSMYPSISSAESYVQLLHDICELRGIPFLDLFHCSGLRPWEASYRALVYSRDDGNGVHPNEIGHKLIAPRFEAFLYSLLLS